MTDTTAERRRVAGRSRPGQTGTSRRGGTTTFLPREAGSGASARPGTRAVSGGGGQTGLAAQSVRGRPAVRPPARRPVSRPAMPRQTMPQQVRRTRAESAATTRRAGTRPRMPFVLLVLTLLGGGLICLLVINTTLGAASFRISQLQKTNANLSTQEQGLQEQVALEQAPAEIAKRAYQLGMRVQTTTRIVDLRTHQTYSLTGQAGVDVSLGAPPASASPAASATPATSASPASQGTPKPGSTPQQTVSPTPPQAAPSPNATTGGSTR